jgi:hypothetical protein
MMKVPQKYRYTRFSFNKLIYYVNIITPSHYSKRQPHLERAIIDKINDYGEDPHILQRNLNGRKIGNS